MGWWFGDSQDEDEEYGDEHAEVAVRLCKECPIRTECLTQAITFHESSGVWGGMTANQRQQLRGRI